MMLTLFSHLKKMRLRLAFIGLAFFIIGAGLPFFVKWIGDSQLFAIQTVTINGLKHVSQQEILAYLNDLKGQSLYQINLDDVKKQVERHPWVKTALINRAPPHELQVIVTERLPVALIVLDKTYILGDDGKPFQLVTNGASSTLPLVTGFSKDAYQNNYPEFRTAVKKAVDCILAHQRHGKAFGTIKDAHVDDALGVVVNIDQGPQVVLGHKDFDEKWAQLLRVASSIKNHKQISYAYISEAENQYRVAVRFAHDNPMEKPAKSARRNKRKP